MPSSNLSMFSVTSFTRLLALERIHLSAMVRSAGCASRTGAFSIFIIMKRLAFHTLLAKFLLASTRSQ